MSKQECTSGGPKTVWVIVSTGHTLSTLPVCYFITQIMLIITTDIAVINTYKTRITFISQNNNKQVHNTLVCYKIISASVPGKLLLVEGKLIVLYMKISYFPVL